MKFFKKRSVALTLCVLLVLASTLLNTRIKLGGMCEALSERFYAAEGIGEQLQTLRAGADALAALAENNGIGADALKDASAVLQSLLSQRTVNAGQLHANYTVLCSQLNATAAQLKEKDVSGADTILSGIQSIQNAISSSGYNAEVREFRSRNGSLFTRLLASLSGVRIPEEFA